MTIMHPNLTVVQKSKVTNYRGDLEFSCHKTNFRLGGIESTGRQGIQVHHRRFCACEAHKVKLFTK